MRRLLARFGIGLTTGLVVLSLSASALSVGLSVALYVKFSTEAHDRTAQIRQGQIQNCHVIGEPIRLAVIHVLQDQIAQSRSADLKAFFPQIPSDKLKALIADSNKKRQAIADRLIHVPSCELRYSPSFLYVRPMPPR